MGFSLFHMIGILSGMKTFVPYRIDFVKLSGFSNEKIIFIFILLTDYDFIRWKQIYLIFYFLHILE